jgi:hypothetical protein
MLVLRYALERPKVTSPMCGHIPCISQGTINTADSTGCHPSIHVAATNAPMRKRIVNTVRLRVVIENLSSIQAEAISLHVRTYGDIFHMQTAPYRP